MNSEWPAIEIGQGDSARYAVIWLHGLGADGSDFVPVVPELGLPKDGVRFIFPHAPHRPVTCNGGYVMPAWYDIISLAPDSRQIDEAGLLESCSIVADLIARENSRGIPCERIFLAGFSQGGAVAYTAALRHASRLAGVIALSTYIPAPDLIAREASAANRDLPIFAAHGLFDDVVGLQLGQKARDFLLAAGYQVKWHEYGMDHSVCIEEIQAIGAWLADLMA